MLAWGSSHGAKWRLASPGSDVKDQEKAVISVRSAGKDFDLMPGKFVLIGSGLAGGLLAAYLGRQGYEVELYERRGDPREGNTVGGRSINLALSTRGIYALEELGIADEVLRHAIPMRGRMIHEKSGRPSGAALVRSRPSDRAS